MVSIWFSSHKKTILLCLCFWTIISFARMNFKQVLNKLDEFEEAVKKAVSDVRLDNDVVVSVFETNIRVLGYESYVYIIYYTAFVIFLRFVLTALFEVLFFLAHYSNCSIFWHQYIVLLSLERNILSISSSQWAFRGPCDGWPPTATWGEDAMVSWRAPTYGQRAGPSITACL